jgi:hypothetical protein
MGKPVRLVAVLAAVAAIAGLGSGMAARATSENEPCTDGSRECVIASADTYLQALVSHDASEIRLAPDARRTENGLESGNNAEEIRSSLEPPTPDESITGIRDKRWWVDGDQAIVYYLADTSTLPPVDGVHTTTTRIAERFKVVGGLIHEIEAIFWVSPGPTPEGSGWE